MQGHAAANVMPLVAVNRIGIEDGPGFRQRFYGSSFIAGPTGEILAEAPPDEEALLIADLDFAAIARRRVAWGVFRDRRPELYGALAGHGAAG
jgi:N-carbamoylputrescine amidase